MSIFNMSLSASFVILVAIVLRWFFIYQLPKKAFLLLWAIVLFRLLVPLSMPSNLSVWNMVDGLLETSSGTTALLTQVFQPFPSSNRDTDERAEPKMAPAATRSFAHRAGNRTGFMADSSSLFGLWLSGATFCFLWFLLPHLYCRRTYKTAVPVKNIFVTRWLADHPLRRRLSVKQSGSVEAPLTYGILRPVILLPQTMDLRDETRLSHVLAHEYFHVRHLDALWKWVLALTLAVHWFNPFVWLMYIFANRDIELCCDETVVRSTGERAKPVYAMTLLDLEDRRGLQWDLCANFFNGNTVEERIISIMKTKRASCLSVLAALLMIVGTTALFATDRAVVTRAAVGYTERMLFTTRDSAVVKVTYDGATWQAYSAATDRENWNWYTEQEYIEYMKQVAVWVQTQNCQDNKYSLDWNSLLANTSMRGVESDPVKLAQTLADIQNGIRVSKPKTIYLKYGTGPNSESIGWVHWYCYGFTFQDDAGKTVDLGLFETRDALFGALKRYYDGQVAAGTLTEAEAGLRYGKIAHNTRNLDEVPLPEKLLNRHAYNPYNTF